MSNNNGIPLLWLQLISFALLVVSAYYDLLAGEFKKPLPDWWYWTLVGVIFSETSMGKAITIFVTERYESMFKKGKNED